MELGKNLYPTDIDAMIEWKNKCWVLYEVKEHERPVPTGQRLCIERFINDCGKPALALIVSHDQKDANQPIYLIHTYVRELYFSSEKKWRLPTKRFINTKEATEKFINLWQ